MSSVTGLSRRQLLRLPAGLAAAGAMSCAFGGCAFGGRAFGDSAGGRDLNFPSHDVLSRLIGLRAKDFNFNLDHTPADRPWYRSTAAHGAVRIEGSDPVALTRGAYAYLKAIGAASVSWEGDRVVLPSRFPDFDSGRVETPFRARAYLNPCTFGYTTPWWGWTRWEREIDWMALHGIDMPLALEGQEFVWQSLWREIGLSEADLARHFSAAPFLPWQRMGNIEGYAGPLSPRWIEQKRDLQGRILDRMRSLGMTPILPGFAGYVPQVFAARNPRAKIYQMRSWEGFAGSFWLDPTDPLFAQISDRFFALYHDAYGLGSHYLIDSFNETLPPLTDDGADLRKAAYGDATAGRNAAAAAVPPEQRDQRLSAYGRAIYESVRRSVPHATWVMQSWMFGADRNFWTQDAIGAFLRDIPDDRLMVLDIGNDRYPDVWTHAQAFQGKSWIYGYVHNYGGSNPVYGDIDFYRRDLSALLARSDKGRLSGFGVFPEGLHATSIVYEYLYDLAWGGIDRPIADWLREYLRARYGTVPDGLVDVWAALTQACLSTRYWTPRWWHGVAGAYLLFKRPATKMTEFEGYPGDRAELQRAVGQLAALADDFPENSLFDYDLASFVRHLATEDMDGLLRRIIRAYQRGSVAEGDADRRTLAELVTAIDQLAGVEMESLTSWEEDARASSQTPEDATNFVRQAKTQITLWGGAGSLHDYASKAWQGLYAEFYLVRWEMFFEALRVSAETGHPFDETATTQAIAAWEKDWTEQARPNRRERPLHPARAARHLLDRLAQI